MTPKKRRTNNNNSNNKKKTTTHKRTSTTDQVESNIFVLSLIAGTQHKKKVASTSYMYPVPPPPHYYLKREFAGHHAPPAPHHKTTTTTTTTTTTVTISSDGYTNERCTHMRFVILLPAVPLLFHLISSHQIAHIHTAFALSRNGNGGHQEEEEDRDQERKREREGRNSLHSPQYTKQKQTVIIIIIIIISICTTPSQIFYHTSCLFTETSYTGDGNASPVRHRFRISCNNLIGSRHADDRSADLAHDEHFRFAIEKIVSNETYQRSRIQYAEVVAMRRITPLAFFEGGGGEDELSGDRTISAAKQGMKGEDADGNHRRRTPPHRSYPTSLDHSASEAHLDPLHRPEHPPPPSHRYLDHLTVTPRDAMETCIAPLRSPPSAPALPSLSLSLSPPQLPPTQVAAQEHTPADTSAPLSARGECSLYHPTTRCPPRSDRGSSASKPLMGCVPLLPLCTPRCTAVAPTPEQEEAARQLLRSARGERRLPLSLWDPHSSAAADAPLSPPTMAGSSRLGNDTDASALLDRSLFDSMSSPSQYITPRGGAADGLPSSRYRPPQRTAGGAGLEARHSIPLLPLFDSMASSAEAPPYAEGEVRPDGSCGRDRGLPLVPAEQAGEEAGRRVRSRHKAALKQTVNKKIERVSTNRSAPVSPKTEAEERMSGAEHPPASTPPASTPPASTPPAASVIRQRGRAAPQPPSLLRNLHGSAANSLELLAKAAKGTPPRSPQAAPPAARCADRDAADAAGEGARLEGEGVLLSEAVRTERVEGPDGKMRTRRVITRTIRRAPQQSQSQRTMRRSWGEGERNNTTTTFSSPDATAAGQVLDVHHHPSNAAGVAVMPVALKEDHHPNTTENELDATTAATEAMQETQRPAGGIATLSAAAEALLTASRARRIKAESQHMTETTNGTGGEEIKVKKVGGAFDVLDAADSGPSAAGVPLPDPQEAAIAIATAVPQLSLSELETHPHGFCPSAARRMGKPVAVCYGPRADLDISDIEDAEDAFGEGDVASIGELKRMTRQRHHRHRTTTQEAKRKGSPTSSMASRPAASSATHSSTPSDRRRHHRDPAGAPSAPQNPVPPQPPAAPPTAAAVMGSGCCPPLPLHPRSLSRHSDTVAAAPPADQVRRTSRRRRSSSAASSCSCDAALEGDAVSASPSSTALSILALLHPAAQAHAQQQPLPPTTNTAGLLSSAKTAVAVGACPPPPPPPPVAPRSSSPNESAAAAPPASHPAAAVSQNGRRRRSRLPAPAEEGPAAMDAGPREAVAHHGELVLASVADDRPEASDSTLTPSLASPPPPCAVQPMNDNKVVAEARRNPFSSPDGASPPSCAEAAGPRPSPQEAAITFGAGRGSIVWITGLLLFVAVLMMVLGALMREAYVSYADGYRRAQPSLPAAGSRRDL
eukprot:gene8909-6245_t